MTLNNDLNNVISKLILDSKNKKKMYIMNTEQATNIPFFSKLKKFIKSKIGIIDYNLENTKFYKNKFLIPYQYNKQEIDKLISFNQVEPQFDVGITFTPSDRRTHILNELHKLGHKVTYIKGWKDERDAQIGKCKILINVHYAPNYNIFEHIRCDRWIMSKKIVISETSSYTNQLDVYNNCIFEPYDNLVNKAHEVLQNYDKYMETVNGYDFSELIENRKQMALEFVDKN
jgi:hypothetical protein